MNEMQNTPMPRPNSEQPPAIQAATLSTDDFTPQEIARLISARDRFRRGELADWQTQPSRLLFARWLYEHGRIRG